MESIVIASVLSGGSDRGMSSSLCMYCMHRVLNVDGCSTWQQSFIKQQAPNKQHYHQWVWFNSHNAHGELYYGKCCLVPQCVQDKTMWQPAVGEELPLVLSKQDQICV